MEAGESEQGHVIPSQLDMYENHSVSMETAVADEQGSQQEFSSAWQSRSETDQTPGTGSEDAVSESIPELCEVCLNGFTTLWKMKEHMMTHSDYKPHQCSQCSMAFKRRSDLKRHLRQHTGEKPFKCPSCDCTFSQSTALQQHMMRRHKGQQPYQCSLCQAGFHRASDWKKHMAAHKGSSRSNPSDQAEENASAKRE